MGIKNQHEDSTDQRKTTTVIAAGSKHIGKFSGTGNYTVYGCVEGDCDIEGHLALEHEATWKGTIRAEDIVISGYAEGDVIANARIQVTETAEIQGNLTGALIQIAEGAKIQGGININKDQVDSGAQPADPAEVVEIRDARQPENASEQPNGRAQRE